MFVLVTASAQRTHPLDEILLIDTNLDMGSYNITTNDLTVSGRDIYMGGGSGLTWGLRYSMSYPNYGIFYTEGTPDYVSISPGGGGVTTPDLKVTGAGDVTVKNDLIVTGDTRTVNLLDSDGSNFFDGGCGDNQHVTGISSTGAVSCAADSGDISGVTAGDDLTGGGTSGAVTLALADSVDVSTVSASGAGGLSLKDDGGNLGIFVEDSGQVGIGTSSPEYGLDVAGTGRFTGQLSADGGLYFGDSSAGLKVYRSGDYLKLDKGSATSGLEINITNEVASVYIDSGSIYLGNSSGGSVVDLRGNVMKGTGWYMESDGLRLGTSSSPGGYELRVDGETYVSDYVVAMGGLHAAVSSADPGTNNLVVDGWMRVTGTGNSYVAGNLGIKKTNPSYKLDIAGNLRTTGLFKAGSIKVEGDYIQLPKYTSPPVTCSSTYAGAMYFDTQHGANNIQVPCVCIYDYWAGSWGWRVTDTWGAICS